MTVSDLPDSILAKLADSDSEVRLNAVFVIRKSPLTQPALNALERLAANDPDPTVRSEALVALECSGAQAIFSNQYLPSITRSVLVQKIDHWQLAGMITPEQAEVLRLHYSYCFQPDRLSEVDRKKLVGCIRSWSNYSLITPAQADLLSASLFPQPAALTPRSIPAVARPAELTIPPSAVREGPVAPSPSLHQALFSETSIRIVLYLGGFLIVAAALILAALVEVARLPVLLCLEAAAAAGAILSRRRLPLPSFVLYIILASLLPILGRVLADLLDLTGSAVHAYWLAPWLLLALVLAVGTRLYISRLLSLCSLGVLVIAGSELAALLPGGWRSFGLPLSLAALGGGLGTVALLRWKDYRFALPLYLGSHLIALAALLFTFLTDLLMELIPRPAPNPVERLYFVLVVVALAAFYLAADRYVRRFVLLPFLAAGVLFFFPSTLARAFTAGAIPMAAIIAAWGVIYALGAAAFDRRTQPSGFLARYDWPFRIGAPILFAWAALLILNEDPLPRLALPLVAAATLTALNVFRTHRWTWSTALLFWLASYFFFVDLPIFKGLEISETYIMLLPGLLLFIPEFFTLSPQADRQWRVPARILGMIVLVVLSFIVVLDGRQSVHQEGAVIFTVIAAFFQAMALRIRRPRVAIATTVFLSAALVMLLRSLGATHWLPWLAGLAVIFYGTGWYLQRRSQPIWSSVFRFSALGLSFLLISRLAGEHDWIAGLSLLAPGGLFLFELLWGPRSRYLSWLEIPLDAVFIAALFGLLNPIARLDVRLAWALGLFLAALIVLGCELFFTRTAFGRQVGGPVGLHKGLHATGILLAAASLGFNILAPNLLAGWVAAIFAVSAGYALLAARLYRLPRLGYVLLGYLALALFYLLRALHLAIWLAPEMVLAALCYASSFIIGRQGRFLSLAARSDSPATAVSPWTEVLRYGGLGLALLVSLTAPLEKTGLWASLWVACAATFYAIEAFRRRSVWWGFPTDGLYLLSYFLLLIALNVSQMQFFSVAVAALGMLQHYLLTRTGGRLATFITGMVSQLVLLGTTYFQMISTQQLVYFVILFFQGLAVLAYGIIIRSRSLVITPLVFIVLGVVTVVLSILSGVPTAIIIGLTGLILLILGILAVLLRERLVRASEKMGEWRP